MITKWVVIILCGVGIGLASAVTENYVSLLLFLILCILFVLFIRNPELPLAIHFGSTIVYFYILYKLGFEKTESFQTGIFYLFLNISYLLGEILWFVRKNKKIRFSSVDLLFILFLFWFYLSYFMFSYPWSFWGNRKALYAMPFIIAPYFAVQFLLSEEKIKKFFNYVIFIPAVMTIPFLYEILVDTSMSESITRSIRFSPYNFESGAANPILTGITFAIPLLILLIRLGEIRKTDIVELSSYSLVFIPMCYLLVRSGARGPLISFLIAIVFYIFVLTGTRLNVKVYAITLITLIIVGVYQFIPKETILFYSRAFNPADNIASVSIYGRISMWKESIDKFKESPILGIGTGNFMGGSFFPHNIILEIASELGIIGLIMFLVMCYLTVKKAFLFIRIEKDQMSKTFMKTSLVLFVFTFTEAMFSGHIANQTELFMSMGLIMSLVKLREGRTPIMTDQSKEKI